MRFDFCFRECPSGYIDVRTRRVGLCVNPLQFTDRFGGEMRGSCAVRTVLLPDSSDLRPIDGYRVENGTSRFFNSEYEPAVDGISVVAPVDIRPRDALHPRYFVRKSYPVVMVDRNRETFLGDPNDLIIPNSNRSRSRYKFVTVRCRFLRSVRGKMRSRELQVWIPRRCHFEASIQSVVEGLNVSSLHVSFPKDVRIAATHQFWARFGLTPVGRRLLRIGRDNICREVLRESDFDTRSKLRRIAPEGVEVMSHDHVVADVQNKPTLIGRFRFGQHQLACMMAMGLDNIATARERLSRFAASEHQRRLRYRRSRGVWPAA